MKTLIFLSLCIVSMNGLSAYMGSANMTPYERQCLQNQEQALRQQEQANHEARIRANQYNFQR